MNRTWKLAVFAMLRATVMLMMSAASAGAGGSPGPAVLVRIESASQKEILARGLEVRVSNKGAGRPIVRVGGSSSTFDVPDFTRLTKSRAVRLRGAKASAPSQRVTVVRLRLTAAGRKQIASCEARTLRVKAAGASDQARLVRDTRRCKPKPVDLSRADRCEFIVEQDGSLCLLPFPDDYYTVTDPSTRTGRRIDLKTAAMPQNLTGKPIDAGPYNLNDGFSPGQAIVLRVPGLDNPAALEKTDPVPIGRIGRYAEPHAPIVLIDAHTGERAPIFVEIDSSASEPQSTALMIQPATNRLPATALSSRCGTSRTPTAIQSARPRASATTATGCRLAGLPSRDGGPTSRGSSTPCTRRGSGAPTCTSPGTSPSPATRTSRRGC